MFSGVKIATTMLLALYSGTTLAEIPVYGVVISAPTTPYWSAVERGLKDGAFEEQADYYLQTAENNPSAEAQLELCNNMLDRKPNVILVAALDAKGLSPCLKKAQSLNIPSIGLGDTPHQTEIYDTGIASVVQSNQDEAAVLSARFIAESLGSDASGSVAIVKNEKEKSLQTDTFTNLLQNSSPDLQVFVTTAQELAGTAADAIGKLEIKAIVSTDNTAALAAINSLPEPIAAEILVVSLDDQADNPTLLLEGKIQAAISPLPYLVGFKAMERASLAMNTSGNDINDVVYIQPILLTRETLEADNNPLLKFIK